MSTYRLLVPCMIGQTYHEAGSILEDGPNGNIPDDWKPNPSEVEPLDGSALERVVEIERAARLAKENDNDGSSIQQ
jgi:hypothetical protein